MNPILNRRQRRTLRGQLGRNQRGLNPWFLATGDVLAVISACTDAGLFPYIALPETCGKCARIGKVSQLRPDESDRDNLNFRCKTCGHRVSFRDLLIDHPEANTIWLPKVPLRKQLAIIWDMCQGKSVNSIAEERDCHANSTVRTLFRSFVNLVAESQD